MFENLNDLRKLIVMYVSVPGNIFLKSLKVEFLSYMASTVFCRH
jgi:hypothetical protein